MVETCLGGGLEPPRPLSMFKVMPLNVPNLFNGLSLLIDLMLIR
jgi:hypothetical protein